MLLLLCKCWLLLPVSGAVDGGPEARAGAVLAAVRAVRRLQVATRSLQTSPGTRARGCASPEKIFGQNV